MDEARACEECGAPAVVEMSVGYGVGQGYFGFMCARCVWDFQDRGMIRGGSTGAHTALLGGRWVPVSQSYMPPRPEA